MGKLQELLAKSREEKNGNSQSVLQSPAVQETHKPTPHTGQEKNEQETRGAESSVSRISEGNNNSVVEQGPPPGLKGLALLQWKKANPDVTNKPSSPIPPIPEKNEPVLETLVHPVSVQEAHKPIESQTTKNNGTVDSEELRRNLIYLANNIEQKELVGQVVRTISVQIKNNPALMGHMKDEDMDLLVRGLRRSFAIVARKKSEAREAKQSKTKAVSELEQSFRDAGFKLDLG